MRWLLGTILVMATCMPGFSQAPRLSAGSDIHVITCGPWQGELYAAFGHSAIRVTDPEQNIDIIYNYGVFDFNQPNFYLNFARGFLNYKLEKHPYRQFLNYYIYYDRDFIEQILNLTLEQKQAVFDFLEWNVRPENQYYRYDYFYDNCATRIRDALTQALGGELLWDENYVQGSRTIRELTDDYLTYQPWGDLGIDICLGLPMDREATPFMYMYLPDYIFEGVAAASIVKVDAIEPLVAATRTTYSSKEGPPSPTAFTPLLAGWLIFFLMTAVTGMGWRKRKYRRWIDISWFGLLSLFSVFLLLLWFATDHRAAAQNLNLLWAWPGFLWGTGLLLANNFGRIITWHKYQSLLLFLFAVSWFFLPQQMHPALYPILLVSLMRSFYVWKFAGSRA